MKKIVLLFLVLTFVFSLSGCGKKLENSSYEIEVKYLDSGVIGGRMRFNYVCDVKEGTDILKFNLYANAFREDAQITPIITALKQYGKMEIISVKKDNNFVDYAICGKDYNILQVELGEVLCYGDTATIDIEFGVVLSSGNYRLSIGEDTINIGNWYPSLCVYDNGAFVECEYGAIGDPFYSRCADYMVSLTVPSQYVVGCSANAYECIASGNETTYNYEMKDVRDFAFCLSKKFNVLSEKCQYTTVNYYYYDDDQPQKTMDVVKCAIDYFSETFGEYPYSSFSVCQSDFNQGGMEYSGLVYVNDELNLANKLYTAVHETAHQWWYGVVGNNQLNEAFLDEGLTEYSTAVFFSEHESFGIDADVIFENAKKSCSMYGEILQALGENPDYKMIKNLSDYNGEMEYVNASYNRGLTMFKSCEDAISRKKLLGLLSGYYDDFKFDVATSEDLLRKLSPVKSVLSAYIEGKCAL